MIDNYNTNSTATIAVTKPKSADVTVVHTGSYGGDKKSSGNKDSMSDFRDSVSKELQKIYPKD